MATLAMETRRVSSGLSLVQMRNRLDIKWQQARGNLSTRYVTHGEEYHNPRLLGKWRAYRQASEIVCKTVEVHQETVSRMRGELQGAHEKASHKEAQDELNCGKVEGYEMVLADFDQHFRVL